MINKTFTEGSVLSANDLNTIVSEVNNKADEFAVNITATVDAGFNITVTSADKTFAQILAAVTAHKHVVSYVTVTIGGNSMVYQIPYSGRLVTDGSIVFAQPVTQGEIMVVDVSSSDVWLALLQNIMPRISGTHTNEIGIINSDGNVQAGGKTLSDLIEQPAVAGTDGQVLTSDGQGGVAWETPQGGGSDTSTIQEVSATALTDLNERVERLNGGHLRTATGFKKVLTVEDYLSIYGVFATNLTTNLNNQGLAASQGKYLKDLSDVNEQILANALVELALGVTIWRNIAAEFSPSTAYNVGDYCFYSGILYRCTTSASASPTFDNTKFEQTTVMAEIIRLTTNA